MYEKIVIGVQILESLRLPALEEGIGGWKDGVELGPQEM